MKFPQKKINPKIIFQRPNCPTFNEQMKRSLNWKYITKMYKNNFSLDFTDMRKKKLITKKKTKLYRQNSVISNFSTSRLGGGGNSGSNSRAVLPRIRSINQSLIDEEPSEELPLAVNVRRVNGGRNSISSPVRIKPRLTVNRDAGARTRRTSGTRH